MRFGTDGIRGRAGTPPIDRRGAFKVGVAAAQGAACVIVAHDTRPSGDALARSVAAGAAWAGAPVQLAGVLPSPGLAAAVAAREGAHGVMVTASHNPADDNGFKVLLRGGHKPDDAQTAALESAMAAAPADLEGAHDGPIDPGPVDAYRAAFLARIGLLDRLRGRRLVVDCAEGAVAHTAPGLLQALGLDAVCVGVSGGPINAGVGSEHPEHLVAAVAAHGAFAGIAVDGDGDRGRIVDGTGAIWPGDVTTAVLAAHRRDPVVAVTVMTTSAFAHWLPDARLVVTPVGDRHLARALAEDGATLGGEDSGHLLFADGLPGGDGLFTGLRALEAWLALKDAGAVPRSGAPFTPFPRRLTKISVGSRPPLDGVPAIGALVEAGQTQLGPGGRVFLRYSGTEPVLRVLVEGREAATVDAVSAQVTSGCAAVLG